jgi:hypothetical protein
MTPKQLFSRLRAFLKSVQWEGTSNDIFGDSVYVVAKLPIELLSQYRHPSAFIIDRGAVPDGEHPGLLTQNFSIVIFVENIQSNYGESAMLGGGRVADTSRGSGLLDIEEEIFPQIIETSELTTKIMIVEKTTPKPIEIKDNRPLVFRDFAFRALVSVY